MVSTENDVCKLEIIDLIVFARFKTKTKIELQHARELVSMRKDMAGGKDHVMMLDGRNVVKVSKEARDFLASEEATDGLLAGAFLINSALTSILGNFFLKINKPNRPSKIFTSETEAVNWLKMYLDN